MSSDSALCDIIYQLFGADPCDRPAILSAATSLLQSLTPADAKKQLLCQRPSALGLLSVATGCTDAAPLLTLMLERGREFCSTTNQMDPRTIDGLTPLHYFAYSCPDLSLTKMVFLEHPPALLVQTGTATGNKTPLQLAENNCGPKTAEFLRDATAAYEASDYVTIERICGGSSPYLARELSKQATALRVAVNICLKRQEEAPSDLISPETRVALALLGLARDKGRDRHSSHLLRRVLEYVGPYASSGDAD